MFSNHGRKLESLKKTHPCTRREHAKSIQEGPSLFTPRLPSCGLEPLHHCAAPNYLHLIIDAAPNNSLSHNELKTPCKLVGYDPTTPATSQIYYLKPVWLWLNCLIRRPLYHQIVLFSLSVLSTSAFPCEAAWGNLQVLTAGKQSACLISPRGSAHICPFFRVRLAKVSPKS